MKKAFFISITFSILVISAITVFSKSISRNVPTVNDVKIKLADCIVISDSKELDFQRLAEENRNLSKQIDVLMRELEFAKRPEVKK